MAEWSDERVGFVEGGPYAGRYVLVEADRGGFHIWLSERHPGTGPSPGWDICAEDEEQVDEWFASDLSSVTWDDRPTGLT